MPLDSSQLSAAFSLSSGISTVVESLFRLFLSGHDDGATETEDGFEED